MGFAELGDEEVGGERRFVSRRIMTFVGEIARGIVRMDAVTCVDFEDVAGVTRRESDVGVLVFGYALDV